jgi:pilus assembly protein Flp/PilA
VEVPVLAGGRLTPGRPKDKERVQMLQSLRSFLRDDEGQGLVEYALLLSLIAVVSIGAITTLGDKVKKVFDDINAAFK